MVSSGTHITLIGFLDPAVESFHESLNTLEFCQKFAQTVEISHSAGIVKHYQEQLTLPLSPSFTESFRLDDSCGNMSRRGRLEIEAQNF